MKRFRITLLNNEISLQRAFVWKVRCSSRGRSAHGAGEILISQCSSVRTGVCQRQQHLVVGLAARRRTEDSNELIARGLRIKTRGEKQKEEEKLASNDKVRRSWNEMAGRLNYSVKISIAKCYY